MKRSSFRTVALLFIFGLVAVLAFSPKGGAEIEGSTESQLSFYGASPEWSLVDLDGNSIRAADLEGKVVVVDFWATWCPPCIAEIPGYVALQEKYADKGLVIVGVSLDRGKDAEKKVREFATKYGLNYPLALGERDIVAAFSSVAGDIQAIPTTFLIDRESRVRHHKVGSMETADYEALIQAALN